MSYLLDTDTCVALLRGRPNRPRLGVSHLLAQGVRLSFSAVSLLELTYGALRSSSPQRNLEAIRELQQDLVIESLTPEDARCAAAQRAEMARRGTPIGPYDLLIAGQALARDRTLVTGNVREFERVEGLRLENWLLD